MDKMVKCKSCGADIAKSAKTCPHCGAKQKHSVVPIVIGVIVVLFVIGAIAGGGSNPEKVGSVNTADDGSTSVGGTSAVDQSSQESVFGVGDIVTLDGVNVTLLSVQDSSGSQFFTPTDGNTFVLCEFEIDNQSDSDISVSSILSFEAYFDDYSTSLNLSAISSSDTPQLDGSVAAGKKMSGIVGYQVPTDWKTAEIRFTPDFWSGGEIIFQYTK